MSTVNKQLLFFLTPSEQVELVAAFESHNAIYYCQAGVFSSSEIVKKYSLTKEPLLGYLDNGDWNHSPAFLIGASSNEMVSRTIVLNQGGYSYAVDQQKNPDTVIFKPSGVFTEGILLAGSLTTGSSAIYAKIIFQDFSKIIKKHTNKIGAFYVSPGARANLMLGWRLVTTASSPKEYDLTLD